MEKSKRKEKYLLSHTLNLEVKVGGEKTGLVVPAQHPDAIRIINFQSKEVKTYFD